MITLAIRRCHASATLLLLASRPGDLYGSDVARVPFGHPALSCRRDPIRLAWARLEAKWAMGGRT